MTVVPSTSPTTSKPLACSPTAPAVGNSEVRTPSAAARAMRARASGGSPRPAQAMSLTSHSYLGGATSRGAPGRKRGSDVGAGLVAQGRPVCLFEHVVEQNRGADPAGLDGRLDHGEAHQVLVYLAHRLLAGP